MKKLVSILIICVLALNAKGQQPDSLKNKLKVNFGFMLSPQGCLSAENPSNGFTASIPLFVIIPIEKGNLSLAPIYSLTDNAVGGFIQYSFRKLGVYAVGIRNIQCSGLYLGVGAGIPVAQKRASAFIEVGALRGEWDPLIFAGLSIPFTVK